MRFFPIAIFDWAFGAFQEDPGEFGFKNNLCGYKMPKMAIRFKRQIWL